MPSRTSTSAATVQPPPRFELPDLKFDLGNITDGTNIPPPPKSPVRQIVTPTKDISDDEPDTESKPTTDANGNSLAGSKRPADEVPPLSPAPSTRPGSLRRMLSRSKLNGNAAEGRSLTMHKNSSVLSLIRPSSRGGDSNPEEKKGRRSSGWFRRLRNGDGKRASLIFQENSSSAQGRQANGPPPPMIPELKDMETDEGSLGGDELFKNIHYRPEA